jgi:hypothetical protein
MRHIYQGDFGGFLQYAVEQSGCNKKAKEHFRYAASRYKFKGDYKAFQQELKMWSFEKVKVDSKRVE